MIAPNARPYVVVVDDDPSVRELHAKALRQAEMEVAEAVDGMAALHLIRARLPAVIVTDGQMPRLDGLALTRLVRTDTTTRGIPIVMVSSYATSPAFAAEALDAGCDRVFGKPCSLTILREVVRRFAGGANRVCAPPSIIAARRTLAR